MAENMIIKMIFFSFSAVISDFFLLVLKAIVQIKLMYSEVFLGFILSVSIRKDHGMFHLFIKVLNSEIRMKGSHVQQVMSNVNKRVNSFKYHARLLLF